MLQFRKQKKHTKSTFQNYTASLILLMRRKYLRFFSNLDKLEDISQLLKTKINCQEQEEQKQFKS